MTRTIPERLAALATALAAAVVVIAIAILPFLTPAWVSFEQGRTHAASLSGITDEELSHVTNSILHDLVVGPPEFDAMVSRIVFLSERERAHMRDVRGVFAGFYALAIVAAVGLAALYAGARRLGHPERAWSAVAAGMRWLVVGVGVAGVIAAVAFDALFELFHTLFFPAGSFTFDPRTDHLVQLFPFDFWSETTIVLGVVIVAMAAVVAVVTGRRARAGISEPATSAAIRPEPAR